MTQQIYLQKYVINTLTIIPPIEAKAAIDYN
jgi:hypothetical protein